MSEETPTPEETPAATTKTNEAPQEKAGETPVDSSPADQKGTENMVPQSRVNEITAEKNKYKEQLEAQADYEELKSLLPFAKIGQVVSKQAMSSPEKQALLDSLIGKGQTATPKTSQQVEQTQQDLATKYQEDINALALLDETDPARAVLEKNIQNTQALYRDLSQQKQEFERRDQQARERDARLVNDVQDLRFDIIFERKMNSPEFKDVDPEDKEQYREYCTKRIWADYEKAQQMGVAPPDWEKNIPKYLAKKKAEIEKVEMRGVKKYQEAEERKRQAESVPGGASSGVDVKTLPADKIKELSYQEAAIELAKLNE